MNSNLLRETDHSKVECCNSDNTSGGTFQTVSEEGMSGKMLASNATRWQVDSKVPYRQASSARNHEPGITSFLREDSTT